MTGGHVVATDGGLSLPDRIARYVESNSDATVAEVLGALDLPPDDRETVAAVLDDDGGAETIAEPGRNVTVEAAEPSDSPGKVPEDGGFPDANPWLDAEVSAPASGVYPEDLDELEKWMGAGGETGKQAFAPWADRDRKSVV